MLTRLKKVRSYKFCLRPSLSPTYYNLSHYLTDQGWTQSHFNYLAHFSEKHFEFHLAAAECLEFKHLLARLVAQYCPHIMPITYCINDQNWPLVLNQLADEFYSKGTQLYDQIDDLAWILKPALLNNGQYIKIFQKLSEIEQHYLSAQRLGGEHVIQHYLQPHLLQGPKAGHKYSIRMFVVLTNYGAFLYPHGYFNVGLLPYKSHDFTDIRSHLTNEHLNEHELNVVQIPTQQYELFTSFYPEIKAIVRSVIDGLGHFYCQAFNKEQSPVLAIFGFDFMVDQQMKVWLLEANHAPCFPIDEKHPLQNNLYYHFWQDFINSFVLPIALKQPIETIQYQSFEQVGSFS